MNRRNFSALLGLSTVASFITYKSVRESLCLSLEAIPVFKISSFHAPILIDDLKQNQILKINWKKKRACVFFGNYMLGVLSKEIGEELIKHGDYSVRISKVDYDYNNRLLLYIDIHTK